MVWELTRPMRRKYRRKRCKTGRCVQGRPVAVGLVWIQFQRAGLSWFHVECGIVEGALPRKVARILRFPFPRPWWDRMMGLFG